MSMTSLSDQRAQMGDFQQLIRHSNCKCKESESQGLLRNQNGLLTIYARETKLLREDMGTHLKQKHKSKFLLPQFNSINAKIEQLGLQPSYVFLQTLNCKILNFTKIFDWNFDTDRNDDNRQSRSQVRCHLRFGATQNSLLLLFAGIYR